MLGCIRYCSNYALPELGNSNKDAAAGGGGTSALKEGAGLTCNAGALAAAVEEGGHTDEKMGQTLGSGYHCIPNEVG